MFVSDVDKYCNDTDTVATDNNNYENDDGDEMDEGVYDRPANGIFPTTAAAPVEGAVRSNSGLIVEEEEEDEEAVDGAVRGFKLSQNEFISTIIAPTDNSDAESYDSDIVSLSIMMI